MNEIYEGYTTSTTWDVRPVEESSKDKTLRIKIIFDEFEEKILETFND